MTKHKLLVGSLVAVVGIVGSIIWYLRSDHIPSDAVVAGCIGGAQPVAQASNGSWRAASGDELSAITCRATSVTFRVDCRYRLTATDGTGARRASEHHAVLQHQRDGWHCVSNS